MTTPKDDNFPAFLHMSSAATEIERALRVYGTQERIRLRAGSNLRKLQRKLRRAAKTSCNPVDVIEIALQMKIELDRLIMPDGIWELQKVQGELRAATETEHQRFLDGKSNNGLTTEHRFVN